MLPACVIEDPPPYTQPQQTPPRLDLRGADPLVDQVIVRRTGDPIDFRVPVTSEDAGDELFGVLLLDYNGQDAGSDKITFGSLPPSTLDDTSRALTLTWSVRIGLSAGCHRFTLRVSHFRNFGPYPAVLDKSDVAEAYWWANIDPNPDDPYTLVNCPLATSGSP